MKDSQGKQYLYSDVTERIIGAAFAVHNVLGKGLSEKTYENALAIKLRELELTVEQQKDLPVIFHGQKVGEQTVDLLVCDRVIVEVKAVPHFTSVHQSQLLGYLKNTTFQLGLLINFGSRVQVKRLILTAQNR